ncbi:unnamed protein product [Mytilus edulis]|uniref:CCHC-type domain-containing protein n=1 Tax=Mytilus edulis TaxID=6550 RepID=A0A8S3U124_MYTED|nr:unnamed protein product [Mytilus edulis]
MTKSLNFDSANSTVNKEKMAETYSKVVQNGNNNDMSVKPIFLLESDMFGPKPSDKDFLLHHELYKIIGQLIPSSHLRALQRVRGMWRVYTQGEDDRSKLLISGIVVRDRLVNFYSQNPRFQGSVNPDHVKIRVKDIPCSADDGQITYFLENAGCKIHRYFRERIRVDGLITNCLSGDRIFYCEPMEHPFPRQVTIGNYRATILHKGQSTKNRDDIVCKKCLEKGHFISNCPNDWTCNICKKSGHKQSECEEPFSDNNNEHNENESTNTDDDNTDSETDDNNNDEAAHAQQHEPEVEQMQDMPNEQSQETLTRDLKKTQNKNSQKVPTHQSQPSFQSITNEENDEYTGDAATPSSKKAKKKSGKKKTTCQNDSKDEKQSSMQQFLVEKQTSATTPGNKVSKRSATTPTTDLFDRENQTTKPKTQS